MTNAQIYSTVNAAASQAFGASAVAAVDTGTFVSLGNQVLSSSTSIDAFYSSLIDRIYQTIVVNRPYEAMKRNLRLTATEFGAVLQKISFEPGQAKQNDSWIQPQADPFNLTASTIVTQKLFSKRGTWQHSDVLPEIQVATAFTNESAMAAFIAGIYTAIMNLIQLEIERMDSAAVNTMMANTYKNGTATQKRNLLTEYNTVAGTTLTAAAAINSPGFLRYAAKEITQTVKFMRGLSTVYNAGGAQRHTPESEVVVETLTEFSIASQYYMESDTYHDDLARLGVSHTDINYWQGIGTTNDFAARSQIQVINEEIDPNNPTDTYTVTGILANVRDREAVGTMFDRFRVETLRNPGSEVLNCWWKADRGYFVDPNEQNVIFFVA
jgi:hypothetical protein